MTSLLIVIMEVAAVVVYVAITVAVIVLVVKGLQKLRKWAIGK